MNKEDLIVEIQSRFGLTTHNLRIDFEDKEGKVTITYDLNGYEMKRPLNLDHFWAKLQDLPSAETQEINAASKKVRVSRQELEDLLAQLDPPIQA